MHRRSFIGLFGSAATWPLRAYCQQSHLIGVLVPGSHNDAVWKGRYQILIDRLRELGWQEGRNLAIEWRVADANLDTLPRLAAELVHANVEVILVNTAGSADIAHQATSSIPIVVAGAGDLEGTTLIQSLRKPGGNVTGTQTLNPDLMGKRLELLKELTPSLAKLALIEPITSAAIITKHYIQAITETSDKLGIEVHRMEVRRSEEFRQAFSQMATAGDNGALVITNPLSLLNRSEIVEAALRNKIPTMYESRPYVASGGLVSYGPDISELYRGAADIVDKILRGEKPADLPIMQSSRFELVINLKAAKALGLTVAQSLIARADEIIE